MHVPMVIPMMNPVMGMEPVDVRVRQLETVC